MRYHPNHLWWFFWVPCPRPPSIGCVMASPLPCPSSLLDPNPCPSTRRRLHRHFQFVRVPPTTLVLHIFPSPCGPIPRNFHSFFALLSSLRLAHLHPPSSWLSRSKEFVCLLRLDTTLAGSVHRCCNSAWRLIHISSISFPWFSSLWRLHWRRFRCAPSTLISAIVLTIPPRDLQLGMRNLILALTSVHLLP